MIIDYNDYRTSLKITVEPNKIHMEGLTWGVYTFLIFEPSNKCKVKFNRKTVQAIIIKNTLKTITVLIPEISKEKTISIDDFISLNKYTKTVIRIEKDGVGPYQSKNKPKDLIQMFKMHSEKHKEGEESHQPSQYESFGVYCLPSSFQFAFDDYSQLFNWFSLSEINLMIKHGYQVRHLQQGRDFVDYLHSFSQVAIAKTDTAMSEYEEYKSWHRY